MLSTMMRMRYFSHNAYQHIPCDLWQAVDACTINKLPQIMDVLYLSRLVFYSLFFIKKKISLATPEQHPSSRD